MLTCRTTLLGLSALVLTLLVAGPAAAQPAEGAARDMFRKASSRFGTRPAASEAEKPPVQQASAQPSKATPPKSTPAKPSTPKPKPAEAETEVAENKPAASTVRQAGKNSTGPTGGANGILTSTEAKTPALEPLGLRYSILKQVGQGTSEVDSDTVFHSGDRIKLQVQSSDNAYLYLVLKGSSGRWKVLFPTPEIADGDNRVKPDTTYLVPSNERAWFSFDDQVGSEQLFILLSRQPQADLERMIYDLRRGAQPSAVPTPEAPKPADDGTRIMLASNQREVDDQVIAGIRQKVYSRDLVFEKVEEDEQEPDWTKAVYVVDKDGSADSRIVADVKLEHR